MVSNSKKTKGKKQKKTAFKKTAKLKSLQHKQDSIIDEYSYYAEDIPIEIKITSKEGEFVPLYNMNISVITETTAVILEKVRQELIKRVNLGIAEISDYKKQNAIEEKFQEMIGILIDKYFPDSDKDTKSFLRTYLKVESLGLGNLELLMNDQKLEEIVINQSEEPVWVYHKEYGWVKTNVNLIDEEQIKHYASIIGRRVGRQITVLSPLLDANLDAGDRVNATLNPVSTEGNTITIRKFSRDPWTITKFLNSKTIDPEALALIWMAIQYEMSAIIAGGTASGKTSTLNVFSSLFPPNQRIISIEDTREVQLPKFLHWVPLNTVVSNTEGKGEVSMGDLLVNSLRMRPDRIIVGEVRRKKETETLFEAIHTGHSVYATFHANSAEETIERLVNPPLNVPRIMIPAISLVVVQFRNRRTGARRTFEVAEILKDGSPNVIMRYDAKKDKLVNIGKSQTLFKNISLFTGMTNSEVHKEQKEKTNVLKYLINKDIKTVNGVGRIIAEYYTNKENLMYYVNKNKDFPGLDEINKTSPIKGKTLLDKKCNKANAFKLENGKSLHSLRELLDYIEEMPEKLFNEHVSNDKNDFSYWTANVLGYKEIAKKLQKETTKQGIKKVLEEAD